MESKSSGTPADLSAVRFYQYISPDKENKILDVAIIGGSYAGLSAAMTLGRSVRSVIVIDSSRPCNGRALQAHNIISHDGDSPANFLKKSRQQVLKYMTVKITYDKAISIARDQQLFVINTSLGLNYVARKILFASGVADQMLSVPGFSACWGTSIASCPYCHAYEYYNKPIGILGNGDSAFQLAKLLSNWTKRLILFTNGEANFSAAHRQKLEEHKIVILEKTIARFEETAGALKAVIFSDRTHYNINTLFTRLPFRQATDIPQRQLGCELTSEGLIKVDTKQQTTVPGVYAAGDNCAVARTIALSIAAGVVAGASLNNELTDENFN